MRRPRDPAAFARANPGGRRAPAPSSASHVVSFDEWASRAPRRKKGLRSTGKDEVLVALDEADRMRRDGSWDGARPRHLVALYVQLHMHVYKVPPAELRGKEWTAACLMASRLLAREFSGDASRLVEFISWTWRRERRAHAKGDGGRRRMGWRLQFSPSLVTDYRVELSRRRERAPGG